MMPNRNVQKKEDILIDQKNRKITFCSWIPQKSDSQLVLIHGFSEHFRSYEKIARALAAEGVAVHTMDLPGHGMSDGARGHIDDFQEYVDNVSLFFKSYPNYLKSKPTFLLGHSLGGLIAANFCLQREAYLKGLILSSPLMGLPFDAVVKGKVISVALGKGRSSAMVPKTMGVGTLSRNPDMWEKYRSDPLRLHTISPSLFTCMDTQSRQTVKSAANISLPIITFYSMKDKVVSPMAVRMFMKNVSSLDKTEVVFSKAMHELFQEVESRQILEKMLNWIRARV